MSSVNTPAPGVSYFTPFTNPPAGSAIEPQPDGKPVPSLFKPLTVRGVTFQNRVFLSPLCQYSCKDGIIGPWHLAHLGGIVSRGPGLTVVEATAVLANGRISPEDVGIWSDNHIEGLKTITDFAHSQNQKIGIQIAHAGRKASTVAPFLNGALAGEDVGGWPNDIWGPSELPFHDSYGKPKAYTEEGINGVVDAFRQGAIRAIKAGFDVIEIHAAHGYLISSFLSPTSNKRTDRYGGSFENRVRLLVEVVDAIREVIPQETPLFVRVSGTEWLEEVAPSEPQWKTEDTVRLAPILAAHGVDLLDVSAGGNNYRQKIRAGKPGYQVPFARAVKQSFKSTPASEPKLLVSAVGGLYSGAFAQQVLDEESADVIFVGRYFQKNPGQVWAMAEEVGVDLYWANQIRWAFAGRGHKGLGSDGKMSKVADSTNTKL